MADLNVTPPPNVTITHRAGGISNNDPGVRDLPRRGSESPLPVDESLHGPSLSTARSPSSCGEAAAEIPSGQPYQRLVPPPSPRTPSPETSQATAPRERNRRKSTPMPTWKQMKKLSREAEKNLSASGMPKTAPPVCSSL